MTFLDTVAEAWEQNQLLSVLLELTYRCNLDCVFCYNDLDKEGTALDEAQWLSLLEELADLQVLNLSLTGGEPLASPHFFAIGKRARDLGFLTRIKTNGHAVNQRMAERIALEVDPYLIEVSLHGARPATHDKQTQVPGSFIRLLSNIEAMLAAGLRVKANTTLTKWNEGEIDGMFRICDALGIQLAFDPEVTPIDNGDKAPLELAATQNGLAYLDEVLRRREPEALAKDAAARDAIGDAPKREPKEVKRTKHCGAGSSTATIDPLGNIFPCVQWRYPIGSLHEDSFTNVWNGERVNGIRQHTQEVRTWLTELDGPPVKGFCPGNAWNQMGSPTELYPSAEKRRLVSHQHDKVKLRVI